ncbi:hypothetical protein Y032_0052g2204 [Ancylostoma ceylanicum]|uniref:Uncharacterized protein n=1 Tax=Ancylostoma ceylanicum TaxID=53326 RepID=A0A016U855_9BILA|nr:hypothetical protein Y032_0052g2204 [Ancylostoma ceylanicum]
MQRYQIIAISTYHRLFARLNLQLQKMWIHNILILIMVTLTCGIFKTQKAKFGDPVTLQVEEDVTIWKRVRLGGMEETVQYCNGSHGLGCNIFVDKASNIMSFVSTKFLVVCLTCVRIAGRKTNVSHF